MSLVEVGRCYGRNRSCSTALDSRHTEMHGGPLGTTAPQIPRVYCVLFEDLSGEEQGMSVLSTQ
jgi:hypothetical protein